MPDWLSFWNSPNRIYVNEQHRDIHYRDVAMQIRSLVPTPDAAVLDYGCGEATRAELVAQAAGRLILSDGADAVREKLAARYRDETKIGVLSPAEVAALPAGSIDLIVLNSVSQYLTREDLSALFGVFKRLLSARGRLVVGDVLPPHTSAVTEMLALMKLAWQHGFVLAAFGGLVRTLFSDYRALRSKLGLTHYTEAEMMEMLRAAGYEPKRRHPNIEHNQQRMTFVATPIPPA